MALIATPTSPSTTNLQGGLAGLATTLAMAYLTQAGYLGVAASALGLPVATAAVVATGIIGLVAKVVVSHIAELGEADRLIKAVEASIPKTYSAPNDFPNAPNETPTPNNLNRGG